MTRPRLFPRHRKAAGRPRPAEPVSVPTDQLKPTKAWVSLVVTIAGLVGIRLTDQTAQLVVIVAWVALSWYGVWRARNTPKGNRTRGPGAFL